MEELENWANVKDMSKVSSNLLGMVTQNDAYWEETLNGKMGKTVTFWITYTKIVGLIQLMQRAVKKNDIALYCVFSIDIHIFHDKPPQLCSLDVLVFQRLWNTSQPNPQKVLTEGGFSVNRTRKSFAGVPVDTALE